MPTVVSIVIPTHNRSAILARSLQSLQAIRIPQGITPEILVIANACTDDTQQVVEKMAAGFPYVLRCIAEPKPGASVARNRGIAEARGDVITFLDDDIWAEPEWLEGLNDVLTQQPDADVIMGRVSLWWDAVQKPDWMSLRTEHLLSCAEYGESIRELFTAGEAISANLSVRRRVLEKIPGFATDLDRVGNSKEVLCGGDTDFVARCLRAGFRMFYAPRSAIKHWVAPHRIELKYLGSVSRGNGLARPFLYETFSTGKGISILLKHSFKVAAYSLIGVLGIFLSKRARVNNMIRRKNSQGTLVGTWRRLFGKPHHAV